MLHIDAFVKTLPIVAKGMGGVFLVTLVLVGVVLLLRRIGQKKTPDKEN